RFHGGLTTAHQPGSISLALTSVRSAGPWTASADGRVTPRSDQLGGVDEVGRHGGAAYDLGVVAEAPADRDPQRDLVVGDERVEHRAVRFSVAGEGDGVVLVVVPVVLRGVRDRDAHEALPGRGVQLGDLAVDDDLAADVVVGRLDDLGERALVQLLIRAAVRCRGRSRGRLLGGLRLL